MSLPTALFPSVEIGTRIAPESDAELADDMAPAADLPHPSGVRASPDALAAHLQSLAVAGKTESALTDLLVTAKFLSAAVNEARETSSGLVREIASLVQAAEAQALERARLEEKIVRLERAVEQGRRAGEQERREADAERARLVNEHDAFLAMLLSDHDRELDALRRRPPVKKEIPELPRPPRPRLPSQH